jgi:uncharacterized OB-fold protein
MTAEREMPTDPTAAPIAPPITELNRPFWEGCAAGELRLQRCLRAGHLRYPISEICPQCLSPEYEWQALSGRGEILSWVVFQRGYEEAWAALVPYNVVLVQLSEGPRMFGNIEPVGRTDLTVGAPVRVVFAPSTGGTFVPRWRIVEAAPGGEDHSATAVSP